MTRYPSEREQVRGVAQQWRARHGGSHWRQDAARQEVQRRLDALDVETATAADVAAIIGNDTWVGPAKCDDCGTVTFEAVIVGEPEDDESRTATACADCLRAALHLLGHAGAAGGV